MMTNPPCPQCGGDSSKNGKYRSGTQRYRCKDCDRVFSLSDNKGGRPTIGDKPLTPYERLKRHLDSKKEGNG